MQHAAPRTTGALRRVALPVSVVGLLVASTFALSAGSAGAAPGGGNESCAAGQTEIKFDSNELTRTEPKTEGAFSVTLSDIKTGDTSDSSASPTVTTGSDVLSFDYTASAGLVSVIVKGGPSAYTISPAPRTGNDIVGPPNPDSSKPYGVSNVTFCFAATTTQSPSPSPSVSTSPSASPTASMSPSPSASTSPSPSVTPTVSLSPSPSPVVTTSTSPSPSPVVTTSTSPSPSPAQSGSGGGAGTAGTSPSPSPTATPAAGSGGTPTGGTPTGGTPTVGGSGGAATGDNPVVPQTSGNGTAVAAGSGTSAPVTLTGSSGGAAALPRTGGAIDTLLVVALWVFGAGMVMIGLGRRRRPQIIS